MTMLTENLAAAWTERANRAAETFMEQELTGALIVAPLAAEHREAAAWVGYWSGPIGGGA